MGKTVYIFSQYAVSPNIPGGTRHFNIAAELTKKGYAAYIIAGNFSHYKKEKHKAFTGYYNVEDVNGVNFILVNTFSYTRNNWRRLINSIDYGIKCYRVSLELARSNVKPDVIIVKVAPPSVAAAAYLLSKKLRARLFMDIGELWPEAFATSGKMSRRSPVYILLKKTMMFFYRRAEKIICANDDMRKHFISIGLGARTIYLPPGIRIKTPSTNEVVFKRPAQFRVIYAGAYQSLYPLPMVLEAAKIVKDAGYGHISFIFIGDGTQKDDLVKRTGELGLDTVEFHNPIPKKDIPDFLSAASALILIEKDVAYGFSNKLLDYLDAGRPIIYASPVPNEGLFASGCCIKALNDDPRSIADAVIKIATMSDDKWSDMARDARRYLRENHDIEKISGKLVEAFEGNG